MRRVAMRYEKTIFGPWVAVGLLLAGPIVFLLAAPGIGRALPIFGSNRDMSDRLLDGHVALRAHDMAEARSIASDIPVTERNRPDVRYFLGKLAFFEGDYEASLAAFDGITIVDEEGNPDGFPEYVRRVADATRDLEVEESEHFKVFFEASSPDRVLVNYALETLEAAYRSVGSELDQFPRDKVRVEIFPSSRLFIQASGLKASEIETTGTVALCIYNKLMITTPRALSLGYRWMDTLSHEYVHYVVSQRSRNQVPVWLQEGIAKFFEVRWRGGRGADMTRTAESLLAEALRTDKLVPFEKMSPSLAKLPSAEEAQLAFAQVQTVIEYVIQQRGLEGVRQLMDEMRAGRSDQEAMRAVLGVPFDEFEAQWKWFMRNKHLEILPGLEVLPTILDAQRVAAGEEPVGDKVADPFMARYKTLREFSRLGDLLRERGRFKAALIEYEKGQASVEVASPALAVKIALTHLQGNDLARAIGVLEETAAMYPSFAPAFTTLGMAYMASGSRDEAIAALETSNGINPFDPRIHKDLALLYKTKGNTAAAAYEAEVTRELLEGGQGRNIR